MSLYNLSLFFIVLETLLSIYIYIYMLRLPASFVFTQFARFISHLPLTACCVFTSGNKCFRVVDEGNDKWLAWEDAVGACREMGVGYDLASINSHLEQGK